MSGHQAGFWHPGILAKVFAAEAAAAVSGASAAWVVVDQDANEPTEIALPREGLTRAAWRLGPLGAEVATGSRPAIAPARAAEAISHVPSEWGFVREGVARIHAAMERACESASLARQCTAAAWSMGLPPMRHVYATELSATTVFGELLARMIADTRRCIEAYNAAAAESPAAMIRPLRVHGEQTELPLWELRPGEPRRAVCAHTIGVVPRQRLAPRALLMTGLLRLGACDVFIHGLGGERYDRVTERWFETWLGGSARLARTAVVSATRYLPIGAQGVATPMAVHAARQQARRARYEPATAGDSSASARRTELVAAIHAAPRKSAARGQLFRDLQRQLHEYRLRHADAIAALEARAGTLDRSAAASKVAFDRTWAFPLYPKETLESLRAEIGMAFVADSYRPS